jgi:hypothetical protein
MAVGQVRRGGLRPNSSSEAPAPGRCAPPGPLPTEPRAMRGQKLSVRQVQPMGCTEGEVKRS